MNVNTGVLKYWSFKANLKVLFTLATFLVEMLVTATVALHALAALVSISPTFYKQLLRQNPFAKKLQTQIVST